MVSKRGRFPRWTYFPQEIKQHVLTCYLEDNTVDTMGRQPLQQYSSTTADYLKHKLVLTQVNKAFLESALPPIEQEMARLQQGRLRARAVHDASKPLDVFPSGMSYEEQIVILQVWIDAIDDYDQWEDLFFGTQEMLRRVKSRDNCWRWLCPRIYDLLYSDRRGLPVPAPSQQPSHRYTPVAAKARKIHGLPHLKKIKCSNRFAVLDHAVRL